MTVSPSLCTCLIVLGKEVEESEVESFVNHTHTHTHIHAHTPHIHTQYLVCTPLFHYTDLPSVLFCWLKTQFGDWSWHMADTPLLLVYGVFDSWPKWFIYLISLQVPPHSVHWDWLWDRAMNAGYLSQSQLDQLVLVSVWCCVCVLIVHY